MEKYKKLSRHEINKNIHGHVNEISREFKAGFEELKKYPKSVTIFGSSHSNPAPSENAWKQPESVKVGPDQFINLPRPPDFFTISSPGSR